MRKPLVASTETAKAALVDCPFCGLTACDLIGLKRHFQNGHCDVFNDTPFDDGQFVPLPE